MVQLFNKKKRTGTHSVFQKISTAISIKAQRWAIYLNGKASACSQRKLTFLLFVFCICWVVASIYIVIKACKSNSLPFTVITITVPKPIQSVPVTPPFDNPTTQALKRIQVYIQYLDSLKVYDSSKYRKIQLSRPGLLDSINELKQYYSTLKKLK